MQLRAGFEKYGHPIAGGELILPTAPQKFAMFIYSKKI
jgi:hypothetical protein